MVYPAGALSLILLTILTGIGSAQQRNLPSDDQKQANDNPSWLPKNQFPMIDLSSLCYARLGAEKKTIQIVMPGVTTETFEKEVEKCTMTTETRHRMIRVDGKNPRSRLHDSGPSHHHRESFIHCICSCRCTEIRLASRQSSRLGTVWQGAFSV
jgi:hypothetical protein